jgi:transcription termination factor Rho
MREMKLQDLKSKTPPELLAFAEEHEIENASTMRKQELMFAILKQLATKEVDIVGEGVVEVLSDGFGFLRSPEANYLPGPTTSTSRPRRSAASAAHRRHRRGPHPLAEGRRALLRAAQGQHHQLRGPREGAPQDQLRQPDAALSRRAPEDGARGRDQEGPLSARVIDIVAPIGKGQRALIVSPPRTGKTVLLQNIAHSITANHPECYLIVLLDRRAPGRSHRHAALGEGRRSCPRPSTSRRRATCRSPRW